VGDEERKEEGQEDDVARWFGREEVLVVIGSGWRPSGGRLPKSTAWCASPSLSGSSCDSCPVTRPPTSISLLFPHGTPPRRPLAVGPWSPHLLHPSPPLSRFSLHNGVRSSQNPNPRG
jgi:hypothetical protein